MGKAKLKYMLRHFFAKAGKEKKRKREDGEKDE
jgi:hypothetical protein